jgi:hypothetical protein
MMDQSGVRDKAIGGASDVPLKPDDAVDMQL